MLESIRLEIRPSQLVSWDVAWQIPHSVSALSELARALFSVHFGNVVPAKVRNDCVGVLGGWGETTGIFEVEVIGPV